MSSQPADYSEARSFLIDEQRSLQGQLSELGFGDTGSGTGLDYDANFADSSQVTAERGEAANLAASLRENLAEVERTLDKIDSGRFGLCENCGQTIAAARLEAMPTSRLCIDCVSKSH